MLNCIPDQTIVGLSLESVLLSQIAAQEPAGLTRLYELTASRVFAAIRDILSGPQQAEEAAEVVCDVYLHVWHHAADYDPKRGAVADWLAAIARGRSRERLRQLRAGALPHSAASAARPAQSPLRVAPAGEPLRRDWASGGLVGEAIAGLSPMRKRVLELAFFHGMTHPQIAERTQLPLGTVKSMIRRSLADLQSSLELEA